MKEKIISLLLGVLGSSLIVYGIKGIGDNIYKKGQNDAYKEIVKDLQNILEEEDLKRIDKTKES